jgi:hypothetical protein
VLALQRSAGNRATAALIQRAAACPTSLKASDATPAGWKDYFGPSWLFHCGFRGILEDRTPTAADPMNECFYDHSGTLVDASHAYAACGGTPDEYDSRKDPGKHFLIDKGGVVRSGPGAFLESRVHDVKEGVIEPASRWVDEEIAQPVNRWFAEGMRKIYGYPF